MILHALEAGQGAPVALLHGLFGRAQNFGTLARRLALAHRVVSLDLRNHGASPHAPGMEYQTLAADVQETLADRNALPCTLLGHSMGGKVAMAATLASPSSVTRLIIADIAPVRYRHHNRAVAEAMNALKLDRAMTRAEADGALAAAVPEADVRAFLLQNFQAGTAPAWRIGLSPIIAAIADIEGWPVFAHESYTGPTLFIRAERSGYVLAEHRPAIEALFPAADIVTIHDADHWLHATQPDAFATAVEEFLQDGKSTAAM